MALKSVIPIYDQLTKEWNRKPSPNLDECGRLLDQLKIKLTQSQFQFLPTQNSAVVVSDTIIARDILEIGAHWSIARKDVASFERYMAQLKCYYFDYKADGLQSSPFKDELLGLNLLRLLSQNKLADFHTELELIPAEDLQKNTYIKHPVQIEQYLMEGSYNKVFIAQNSIPAASYRFFMDNLLKTIRNEIASCIEKAYEKILFSECARMMFFDTDKAMADYAQEKQWTYSGKDKMFYFHREKKADDVIPARELAEQAIDYARELEMIV